MKEEREDIGKKFVEWLEDDMRQVYKILKRKVMIKMSEEDEREFQNADICYACGLLWGDRKLKTIVI